MASTALLIASGAGGFVAVVLGGAIIVFVDRLTLSDVAWISGLCTLLARTLRLAVATDLGALLLSRSASSPAVAQRR